MYWLSVHIASVHSENLSDYCFIISRTKDGSGNALEWHMIVKDFFKKFCFVFLSCNSSVRRIGRYVLGTRMVFIGHLTTACVRSHRQELRVSIIRGSLPLW